MERKRPFGSMLLALLFVSLLASQPAHAQHQSDFSEIEKVALEELKQTATPGAVISIVSGDRVVFAQGFGVSNLETGAPATPEMLFRTGSAGKMLTAAALIMLAEENKLKLDEPIGKYVKGLSPKLSRLTTHQLLTHTAGLKDDFAQYGSHDEAALATTIRSWKDDIFFLEPGEIFSYSNLGYALAGLLLEEVSGKSYASVMNDRLFKPLGMTRTTFQPTVAMTYPISQGHGGDPERLSVIRPLSDYTVYWPTGFEFSSVQDLARFARAFVNKGQVEGKQVLAPSVIAKLSTPYVPMHSSPGMVALENAKYGYGSMIYYYRGARVVEHTGAIPGYGCRIVMAPAHRFAVIVMTNQTGSMLNKTIERVMELTLPLSSKADNKSTEALPMTETEMTNYVGVYSNPSNSIEIFMRDAKLFAKISGEELPLKKIGDYRFATVPRRAFLTQEFVLVPGADGKVGYRHRGLRAWKKAQPQK